MFENKEDIPDIPCHSNCRCWVEEQELDDKAKAISSKVYKGQKPGTAKYDEKILSENTPTFDKPINIKPGQSAKFDGIRRISVVHAGIFVDRAKAYLPVSLVPGASIRNNRC